MCKSVERIAVAVVSDPTSLKGDYQCQYLCVEIYILLHLQQNLRFCFILREPVCHKGTKHVPLNFR